jgi:hypothetical protein
MSYNIYSFTPFAFDKNFGASCNQHCESVPNDDDWILIRDSDTAFLIPDYPQQIKSIIDNNKDKFDLIGCYTNRIGFKHQLYKGILSEDTDIKNHILIAKDLYSKYGNQVAYLNKPIAGFFLLFSKKAWKEHKFEEGLFVRKRDYDGTIKQAYIDYWFSNYFVRKKRVGIALGLYIFHIYRLYSKNVQDQNHLKG